MEVLTGNQIRQAFLDFFKDKHNHTVVKSSSLIPDNPTVLLTTAGMLQFIPYYLGLEKPPFEPARATSCQKCARAGGKDSDIENVGRTPRHHTFFEMLGNFAFGDYYKKEVIPWSWDFVTNYLHLDPERLWITIYETDEEAFKIWTEDVGIPPERVIRKGKKDNFWGPPGATGSCGPCTEIHYDLGEDLKCSDDCGIATCECDRWVEIWNLVFTELFQDEEGNRSPLDKKNVDTGMGLERIAMVVQGKRSTFDTDLLQPIVKKVCEITGAEYNKNEKTDVSIRIITDHARCVTFMISDGVVPGNEGRNYVLRMILRRALRHGKILGTDLPFLYKIVDTVIENYKGAYPELAENAEKIKSVVKKEEERFKLTLDRGYKLLEDLTAKGDISGDDAFKLYDTFGFPLELTVEIAGEKGLKVDTEGFARAMKEQKERAKAATQKISLTDDLVYVNIENEKGSTVFTGYDECKTDAKIVATVDAGEFVDVILDKTPFYAECGGQVGDTGVIENDTLKLEVLNTFKVNKLYVHRCNLVNGEIAVGADVRAEIDEKRRKNIAIHHSNAHLLQAALFEVLGDEVKQAGSWVDENGTRFDFSFSRALTKDEIKKVQKIMNEKIAEDLKQTTLVTDVETAVKSGATALFGEKYEDEVRMVCLGDFSKELCGGTHVKSTGEIRLSVIVSESAISAGTRRIFAVCADSAINLLTEKSDALDALAHKFKVPVNQIDEKIEKLTEDNKVLNAELKKLKEESVKQKILSTLSAAKAVNDGKILVCKVDGVGADMIKTAVETLADKLGKSAVVVVSTISPEKSAICVRLDDVFVKKGVNAGKIVSEAAKALGGKGGGRPDFAQGAGKTSENVDEVLAKIEKDLIETAEK